MISALKVSFRDPTAYATAFGIGAFWLVISAVLVIMCECRSLPEIIMV